MTASEARSKVTAKNAQLDAIFKDIKRASAEGEMMITVLSLSKRSFNALKDLGYKVEYYDSGWGDGYDISWAPKPEKKSKKFFGLF